MQYLANYRQTALEQMQALSALGQAEIVAQPPTTFEIWLGRVLIVGLIVLVWWCILED